MANSAEQLSKGCVAMLNLVISTIILGVLVLLLLPDFVKLPEWTEQLRGNKLIEKRKVKGSVKIVPNPKYPSENQVVIFNMLSGGIPIQKIFNKQKNPTTPPLLVTSQKANAYQRIWDKALPEIDAIEQKKILACYDFTMMYLLHEKKLRAWYLENGNEKWQIELESPTDPRCKDCFQLSLDFGTLLVLTQNQVIYSINLKNGGINWQLKLPQQIAIEAGFYVYKNYICLLQSPQKDPSYLLININNGKIQKEIKLNAPRIDKAIKQVRNSLAYFIEDEKKSSLQLIIKDIEEKEATQKIQLPAQSRVFSASSESYQQMPEWWREDNKYIFLKINISNQGSRLLRIDKLSAQTAFFNLKKGYEWVMVDESIEYILLNAIGTAGSQKNELWLVSKISGQVLWSYTLQNPQVFQLSSQNLSWAAHIKGQSLILLEWNERTNLDAFVFQLKNGALLKKNSFQLEATQWEGITWENEEAWLSAQDLYRIDLEQLRMTREFP